MINFVKKGTLDFIKSKNSFSDKLIGGIHYAENSDDEPVYPYAVINFLPEESDRDSGSRYENLIFTMNIFSSKSSSEESSELGSEFDNFFDESENEIQIKNYIPLGVDRISPPREIKTYAGNWQWSADYKIQLQK